MTDPAVGRACWFPTGLTSPQRAHEEPVSGASESPRERRPSGATFEQEDPHVRGGRVCAARAGASTRARDGLTPVFHRPMGKHETLPPIQNLDGAVPLCGVQTDGLPSQPPPRPCLASHAPSLPHIPPPVPEPRFVTPQAALGVARPVRFCPTTADPPSCHGKA